MSHSLFSAVPVDLAAISSFCKWGCVVVHMHQDIRNSSARFKNTIMTCFTMCGPAPYDTRTPDPLPLLGRV